MSMNADFQVILKKENDKGEIIDKPLTIVCQSKNPARMVDFHCECIGKNGQMLVGTFVEKAVEENLIVSPKNLIEQINESENVIELYAEIMKEVAEFSDNPKRYRLAKETSKLKDKEQSNK
ncbi:hypothetical protein [Clostridium botulinum]|uniref:Uncharacterized protein n=1 Tax=Clostridium botulinum CFSAN001627 TaxID=1232189 RepID=M1ZZF6_CLOBO|nr:hypothetical protein [Clostridium botulinum]EKN42965.1 hypothetical protein CFSAN001627_03570 [Clostridium botulinum CFSAN001627]MBY6850337.1 hypothetical protein [Clostridium botulinum]MBY6857397.1 hypothetical protein [Clostridium botulinum]MBY6967367.1 hypothetical protein [Clostridium botulinum]